MVEPAIERDSLQGRRVLVTGARGFLGSNLCDRLIAEGADTHAVSREQVIDRGNNVRWWQADLTDLARVEALLRDVKPDIVVHLSGHVSAATQVSNVLPTFHGLLASTVNLLTVLVDTGCARIVLTGSLTEPAPGNVDAPPSSPYAAAKWAAAAYGRMFHLLYHLPVVIARPFMVYGPRQHPTKIVPYTISSFASGVAPLLASGTWTADWVYVSDVIDAFVRAATVRGIEGSTVELGSGTLTPIREVVARIRAIMGMSIEPVFGALPDRVAEMVRVADIAHTYRTLGWKPTLLLDEGLARTVRWHEGQARATEEGSVATGS